MDKKEKAHIIWCPLFQDDYFYYDFEKECVVSEIYRCTPADKQRVKHFQAFPTAILAEENAHRSTCDKIQVLYQYTSGQEPSRHIAGTVEKWFLSWDKLHEIFTPIGYRHIAPGMVYWDREADLEIFITKHSELLRKYYK